jgi:hypothetical protein
MKVLGSNIIEGEDQYISPDDEALFMYNLARSNISGCGYYTLYKIIHYIEFFHDEKYCLLYSG